MNQNVLIPRRRRIYLLYGSGGGGHRSAALATKSCIEELSPNWDIRLLDATVIAGAGLADHLYNRILEVDALCCLPLVYTVGRVFQPLVHGDHVRRFRSYWDQEALDKFPSDRPALVVSFVPFLNKAMCESLKPFPARQVTVITDFTHSPTHPWLQSHDQFVVCPTGDSYRQSLQLGYDESSCVRISGPVVRPQFYPQSGDEDQKVTWRLRLGLDPTWPTYLLLFGGSPPTRLVEEIALALVAQSNAETQLNIVCICGSNERLFDLLSQHQARGTLPNTRLFGRSDDVPTIMKSVDVVVTKPGPGVVSEALVTRTPLVLFCDGRTMEQELPVETFVRIHGVGKIVDSPSQVYCQSSELVQIRQAMTRLPENQGVFELREFLLSRVF